MHGAIRDVRPVEELHISARLKHLTASASRWRIGHIGSLIAALFAFLLLPGLHVLVHEREATRAAQTQALHQARALLHTHAESHDENAHHHDASDPVPHRHSGSAPSQHGSNAPEHLAAALALAPPLPLIFPATRIEQLAPRHLFDRLPSHPRARAHHTRGPPCS